MTPLQNEIIQYYDMGHRNWTTIARLCGCAASYAGATVAKRHKLKAGKDIRTRPVKCKCPTCKKIEVEDMVYNDVEPYYRYCDKCRPAAMRFHGDIYSIGYGDSERRRV